MWIILGIGAIIFALLNLLRIFTNKNAKWFRFISLSLTALTLWAFYNDSAVRVVNEDWSGLADIMPTTTKALLVCTIISILINSISLFREK